MMPAYRQKQHEPYRQLRLTFRFPSPALLHRSGTSDRSCRCALVLLNNPLKLRTERIADIALNEACLPFLQRAIFQLQTDDRILPGRRT